MQKTLAIALTILCLAGCRPALTPAATAAPSPTAALVPTSTPEPTATPEPTTVPTSMPTALPEGMKSFIFPHYETLTVSYDAALWQSDKGMGQGLLASSAIFGCEISDTTEDAPPEAQYSTRIGSLEYTTTRQLVGNQQTINWFFPPADLAGMAPMASRPVVLVVTSPRSTENDCLEAARAVLATLGASGVP